MVGHGDEGRLVAGRYRLLERIGRGGMGTVWRAEDELLGRQVAVKKLHPPQPHMDEEELATLFERTRREARAAARISHPNVIVVHDVVDDAGLPSIVMEYVPSVTLGERLKQDGALPVPEVARIGRGMIAALRAAHRAGVLHRDVKPGNVLLGTAPAAGDEGYGADRVVLTDFGIAQASGTSTLTRTGELIGSIDFLSPERIRGVPPGPEADLWALGATLYQAVEGTSPFRRPTAIETAYAIAEEPVVPAHNAGALSQVIAGLLAKDPDKRLSAEEAERMLRLPAAEQDTALVDRARFQEQPAPPEDGPGSGYPGGPAPGGYDGRGAYGGQGGYEGTGAYGGQSAYESQGYEGPAAYEGPGGHPGRGGYEPATALLASVPGPGTGGPGGRAAMGGPGSPGGPGGQPRRRRTGRWIAAVVVVAVLAAGAAYAVQRHQAHDTASATAGRTGADPAGTVTAAPTAPPTTVPSTLPTTPVTTPPSSPPPVPDHYHLETQADHGYSVPVPDDWEKKVEDGGDQITYVSPSGLVGLKISSLAFASNDPYNHFVGLEPQTSSQVKDYHRERMERTTVFGEAAALWQFTFTGTTRDWRAIDLGFGKPGAREYAVYLSAPKSQWEQYRPVFDTAVAGFRQTG
jgi:eukaryotic-like serine/threonine-protein kinase